MDRDSDSEDNKNNNSNGSNNQQYAKFWVVEWSGFIARGTSEEKKDYSEALDLFNKKLHQGTDVILYEIQKSLTDSTLLKKTPVLNTKKAKQREELRRSKMQKDENNGGKKNFIVTALDSKIRLIIFASAVAALVVTLLLINSLFNSTFVGSGHYIGFAACLDSCGDHLPISNIYNPDTFLQLAFNTRL